MESSDTNYLTGTSFNKSNAPRQFPLNFLQFGFESVILTIKKYEEFQSWGKYEELLTEQDEDT